MPPVSRSSAEHVAVAHCARRKLDAELAQTNLQAEVARLLYRRPARASVLRFGSRPRDDIEELIAVDDAAEAHRP